jgi:solute carrier family 25 (mitochondrial phosphate transporter), member 23/24/25/41
LGFQFLEHGKTKTKALVESIDNDATSHTMPEQSDSSRRKRLPEETCKSFSLQETFLAIRDSRTNEAVKQLFCGGMSGSVAKTVTAPFSRLTILFQVHSMVTTKEHRPKFAMTLNEGFHKIVERGGWKAMWRGNLTSVLHRFPYSAINFYVYENVLDSLSNAASRKDDLIETQGQLLRRMTKIVSQKGDTPGGTRSGGRHRSDDTAASHKFIAGAVAGTAACLACYPLDLVRTRLTTEFEGHEHYRGILDAFRKIYRTEGILGFYSGVAPTLMVAVPNFAISYTVYGTLKEYTLDDELFYNFRRIDADSGESKLTLSLTVLCGAASGAFATLATFPMDTIRRRMQIQNLHVPIEERVSSFQQLSRLVTKEGLGSLYRGLTPEILKVIPMVGTMFVVYEWSTDLLRVGQSRGR